MKERDKEEPSKSKSPPEGHATRTSARSEPSVPSAVGGASDRGGAVWSMCRRNAGPAGRSVWQLHWKPGLMKRRS